MEIICGKCGKPSPEGTQFCLHCGTFLLSDDELAAFEALKTNKSEHKVVPVSVNSSVANEEHANCEGGTFSQSTIAEELQEWANRLALISKIIFIIGIIVGLIVFLVNIGTYSDNKEYLDYLGNTRYESLSNAAQKAFAAKNAISIGISCVVYSIIGLFLIPVMFGGLYAFGVHLKTNQELLVIQKKLLALRERAEKLKN